MNSLFDFLLAAPAPGAFIRGFLFAGFAAHLLFVLFTLGTAIIGVFYYLGNTMRQQLCISICV